jgi:transcriptional regulator with XRE-family HTH domain
VDKPPFEEVLQELITKHNLPNIHEIVKDLRIKNSLTIQQLALYLKIPSKYIPQMEKGEKSLTVQMLEKYEGVFDEFDAGPFIDFLEEKKEIIKKDYPELVVMPPKKKKKIRDEKTRAEKKRKIEIRKQKKELRNQQVVKSN